MKQFTVTYRDRFGWGKFAFIEAPSASEAKREVLKRSPGAKIRTVRENNPRLPPFITAE